MFCFVICNCGNEDSLIFKKPIAIMFECAICGADALHTCAGCEAEHYCSKKHQKLSWDDGHDEVCEPIEGLLRRSVKRDSVLEYLFDDLRAYAFHDSLKDAGLEKMFNDPDWRGTLFVVETNRWREEKRDNPGNVFNRKRNLRSMLELYIFPGQKITERALEVMYKNNEDLWANGIFYTLGYEAGNVTINGARIEGSQEIPERDVGFSKSIVHFIDRPFNRPLELEE